jgi:hydroxymethylpyrimidine/phosphomethylpyrimidine kinase
VHSCVAVTAVTVQNSVGVTGIVEIPPSTVADQVRAVATDIGVAAAKTGMLASAAIICAVAGVCDEVGIGRCRVVPLVVDPVAASMHGDPLLADDALALLRSELLPRATLVTPNLDEVRLLVGMDVGSHAEQYEAARALHALGPQWVLVKGGHLREDPPEKNPREKNSQEKNQQCLDVLYDGREFTVFTSPRLATPHTHGSGDTLAAAITSALARGAAVREAVGYGKRYIEQAVAHAYPLGAGVGPVSPFWRVCPD